MYILNVKIDDKKPLYYTLIKLYGIKFTSVLKICSKIGLNPMLPISKELLKMGIWEDIQKYVSSNFKIGTILQKEVHNNIKTKVQIKSYEGMRHKLSLPVRGQRTHTNRMTQRRLRHL